MEWEVTFKQNPTDELEWIEKHVAKGIEKEAIFIRKKTNPKKPLIPLKEDVYTYIVDIAPHSDMIKLSKKSTRPDGIQMLCSNIFATDNLELAILYVQQLKESLEILEK